MFDLKNRNDLVLLVFGVLFLLWGLAAVANSLYEANPSQIFWNCYIGMLLIGIGILSKNSKLIGAQLAILGIPLIVWDIDFIYYLVTGNLLWGVTDYFFLTNELTLGKIISLQHLFTLPLALYSMFIIKVKRFDFWKVALAQITLLFLAILYFTNPWENIGCVFSNCMTLDFSIFAGIPYKVLWFMVFFALVFVTNFILWKLGFLRDKKVEREMF